ncbi:MAG: ABC transporter ATP-binding protein [Clostridia bacterium]|nr:ABC transporter ATP-binding protein [Clostridia bacterium]
MTETILQLRNITKVFPHPETPVRANDGVSLELVKGEVHAIVGENGTGKSTLMNILYGLLQPDSGEIILKGTKVSFKNPRDAIHNGIGMVHQHFMLVPSFTVAENLVFGFEPRKHNVFVDKAEARQIASDISAKYGFKVDPDRKIQDCPLSMQQRVEILKILFHGAEILIFDEPTAVLTPVETDELFKAFQALRDDGKTILFITHKLREVMSVADRVTVMRRGKVITTMDISETSVEDLAEKMVGQRINIADRIMHNTNEDSEIILEFDGVNTRPSSQGKSLKDFSFKVRKGEIVGFAGVGGNGQELLVEEISGLYKHVNSGRILYKGKDVTDADAADMREVGIAHITGERYIRGISSDSTIYDNLIMGAHRRAPWARGIFMKPRALRKLAKELIERFSIKAASENVNIMNLSGGNIQKCILARELNLANELIVAEEPTRGVDVGSQSFIHKTIIEKCAEGYGVVLVSTDLDEVLSLSTRIYVMFEGKIVGEVDPESEDARNRIGLLMAGITDEKEAM